MMHRHRLIALGFAVSLVIGVAVAVLAQPARTASVAYPDLRMARLADAAIVNASGQLQLRFSATIVNVGHGPFELAATRVDATSYAVSQKLYDGVGGSITQLVPGANLVWGGDGHSHWHVQNLETYELERIDEGTKVGTGMKSGFCFYDTTPFDISLQGAPSSAVYVPGSACGFGEPAAINVKMGVSVGWGDRYGSNLPDQYINVTNLTSGNYRLWATADAGKQFTELDDTNNTTWVDLKLTTSSKGRGRSKVTVVGYGPTP